MREDLAKNKRLDRLRALAMPSSIFSRIVWTLIMVFLMVSCSVISYLQMRKFIEGQVTLAYSIDTGFEKLDFPSIRYNSIKHNQHIKDIL